MRQRQILSITPKGPMEPLEQRARWCLSSKLSLIACGFCFCFFLISCGLKNKTYKGVLEKINYWLHSKREKQKKNFRMKLATDYNQKLLWRSKSSQANTEEASTGDWLQFSIDGLLVFSLQVSWASPSPALLSTNCEEKISGSVEMGSSPWEANYYYYVNSPIKTGKEFWGWKQLKG